MPIRLSSTFQSFKLFVGQTANSILFTSLFYSIWVVISYISSLDFSLHSFPGRMIGIATLEAFDVGARVSSFYKLIGFFFGSYFLLNLVGYFIYSKRSALLFCLETKIVNYSSLVGVFLFLFQAFDFNVSEGLEIVYFIHKFMLAAILLKILFKKANPSVYHYSFVLCIAVSLYFLLADFMLLSRSAKNLDFYIPTFLFACILLIVVLFYLNKAERTDKYQRLNRVAYALLPLVFLPLISVLKDEIVLILKTNKFLVESRWPVFTMLLALLLLFIFLRFLRSRHIKPATEQKQISRSYFPWLIFSLISYIYYSLQTDYSEELFEMGNVYLPIMEFMKYGVVAPLEKLNAHLLSDYFFGAIYTLFSGLKDGEVTLYDFMLLPVSYLLYYYLMLFLTRNPFISLFSVLLFPFASAIMLDGFCLSVLGIVALEKVLIREQSFKSYITFLVLSVFLIVWRFDMASTFIVLIPVLFLYYTLVDPRYKINYANLLKSSAVVGLSGILIIAGISIYRHFNPIEKLVNMYNYCMSTQSYGYPEIGSMNSDAFKMHYFVFPIAVCILVIVLALRFKSLNKSKNQRLAYLSLVFLCIFYFINFNRGLVRHGLVEGTDAFTSSFIYIIIACAPFILLKKQNQVVKFCVFCLISFFAIVSFKIPDQIDSKSLFDLLQIKLKNQVHENPLELNGRLKNIPADSGEVHRPIVTFIKKHVPEKETFIDFACKPVLYYYAGKETPSWVYQNALCLHNDFLQKNFIEELTDYKTPYLLYSYNPETFDQVDQVPDFLRHYRLAEYFYTYYSPYVILGKFCLWKGNSVADVNQKDTLFRFEKTGAIGDSNPILSPLIKTNPGKNYLIKIVTTAKTDFKLNIIKGHDSLSPSIKQIADTIAYVPLESSLNEFQLLIKDTKGSISHISLVQYDYMPDFYSEQFLSCDFRKLPFVWGQYDKNLPSEPVLFDKILSEKAEKDVTRTISIPQALDKTSGNTVVLSLSNSSKKTQRLYLTFGNSKERGRSKIYFNVLPSKKPQLYAIRVSCLYKWYVGKVDLIGISSDDATENVNLSKLQIRKGS